MTPSKPSKTIFRNSVFGFAAQMIMKVLSFVFSIYIVRDLGAESYGQYSAVMAFVGTFAIFSDLGLSLYSTRQIARWRNEPNGNQKAGILYSNMLSLRVILAILTMVLTVVIAIITKRPQILIIGIALNSTILLLYSVQGSSEAVLGGFERLDVTSTGRIINQLIFVFLGGILLWLGAGYFGLITANLVGILIMAIFCWKAVNLLHVKIEKPTPQEWLHLLRLSIPFGIIGFALGLSYKFDVILLNIFRGDEETGYYNAAYNLVFTFVMFSNVLNTSLFPTLSRLSINAPAQLLGFYNKSMRYLMFIALPIAVGITVLAEPIVQFLYTGDYNSSVLALRILIWVLPLMYASEFLGYVIVISDRESKVAKSVLISTGFNVLINVILVPKFGYVAASITTVLTEMILVGQYIFSIKSKEHGLDWIQSVLLPFLSAIMMGIVVFLLRNAVNLFINIIIGVIVYILLSLLLRVIGKDEFNFAKQLFLRSQQESKA